MTVLNSSNINKVKSIDLDQIVDESVLNSSHINKVKSFKPFFIFRLTALNSSQNNRLSANVSPVDSLFRFIF